MVYAGMNGMEGIGRAVLNGVGGDGEKMGDEEEREKRSFDQFAMVNHLENDRKKEAEKEREKSREREEKFAKKE